MLMVFSITQLHMLVQDSQKEVKHDFLSHMMPASVLCDADSIVNGTITFVGLRSSKNKV